MKLTDKELRFYTDYYRQLVQRVCPRGIKYFCDGSYNGLNSKLNLGPCKFRVKGKCTRMQGYLEKRK